ncbi:MAG: AAA family ATPase [Patescibacteria group bacterium]
MIIGITGSYGSGKDAIAEYLQKKGFSRYSCSDIIREECAKRGLETTRDNLIGAGNELREKFGNDYLAREILKKIKDGKSENSVVVSIRHPGEVEILKSDPSFKMISVDAPLEMRYARTQDRNQNRPEDNDSLEKFKENEEKEKTGTGSGQQLNLVAKMADDIIINDGSFEDLHKKIEEILKMG